MTELKVPHMETIGETAKLFGLPEYFVRQKVLSGEIVAVRAGRKYLVNVDKFAAYLNTATVQQDESPRKPGIIPICIKQIRTV